MQPEKHPIYGNATPEDVVRSLLRPMPEDAASEPEPPKAPGPDKGDADKAA